MSDYTPGGMSDSEPSMEDILASIRKIIADDSSKSEIPSQIDSMVSEGPHIVADTDLDDILDLGGDDFEPFVSEDMSVGTETDQADTEIATSELSDSDDILDLTDSLIAEDQDSGVEFDDMLSDFDADFDLVLDDNDTDEAISLKAGAAVAAGAGAAVMAVGSASDSADDTDMLDLEAMLDSDFDEAEFDLDIPDMPEQVIDPAADLLADDDAEPGDNVDDLMADLMSDLDDHEDAPVVETVAISNLETPGLADTQAALASSTGDADIDLVKSLMAELTEADSDFEPEPEPELEAEATMASDAAHAEDAFDLDDLLMDDDEIVPGDTTGIAATGADTHDMPADDDLASIVAQSSADIEAAKESAEAITGEASDEAEFDISALIDDVPEDDAFEAITSDTDDKQAGLTAAVAGLSALGAGAAAIAASQDDAVPEDIDVITETAHAFDKAESIETKTETAAQTDTVSAAQTPKEDTDMPHIVKSDAIAADETVEAASGAFASLSQVVEDKAVYNESGPRIGDLVQEALKPMLQEWLDKNLKGIVDRAVAKEIKRISSGK